MTVTKADASEARIAAGIFHKVCPATGREGLPVVEMSESDVLSTIRNGRDAFRITWARMPPEERAKALNDIADAIEQRKEQLAGLDSQEMGKPISAARDEVNIAAAFFRFYANAIDKVYGDVAPLTPFSHELHLGVPRGVVAAITPWNFPLINSALKAAPALAAGNTVILKPSPYASASTVLLSQIAEETGLPAGVLAVVTGSSDISQFLVSQPDIDLVTFTGSTKIGSKVMASASNNLTPVLLECGGKSPSIVFADAVTPKNVEQLAQRLAADALWNTGQVCVARNRVYVERPAYDLLTDALVAACNDFTPDDPSSETCVLGPLANKLQFQIVAHAMAAAHSSSATIMLDGLQGRTGESGFYVGPSVIKGAQQQDWVTQQEIFGPIISVMPFEGNEQAVHFANDCQYGLAATLYTRDYARAHQLADLIDVGKLTVTTGQTTGQSAWLAQSAEPAKLSGFGVEGGLDGMKSYTRKKLVEFRHS